MLSCFTSLASTFHCLASCRMKIGLLGCVCLRRSYPSTIVLQTPSLLQTGTRSTQSSSSSNPCARYRRMVQSEGCFTLLVAGHARRTAVGVHRQGGEPAGVESISENKHVWFQDVYRDQVERRRTGISSLALYPQYHGPGGYKTYLAERCVKSFVKRLLTPSS